MNSRTTRAVLAASAALCVTAASPALAASAAPHQHSHSSAAARHVLLLSVDGMHQSDLTWWTRHYPDSALAQLTRTGREYTDAKTTFPSDSFPGMVAQLTGANPGTSGVYYDDTYDRLLDAPGTTNCTGTPTGTEVPWTEGLDRSQNPITLDAGQGLTAPALTALPTNTKQQTLASAAAIQKAILQLTPEASTLIDLKNLPLDPATCKVVYPHDFIRVNSVFDVLQARGYRTAWSDKHPAYEILNGPSGSGIDDLFTPEINSVADSAGDDWTTDNDLTAEYDSFKVAAVLNEIKGEDHSGAQHVGVPSIFGMNFQTLSTAQKLPASDGLKGGYTTSGAPGPLVRRALAYVSVQLGRMIAGLKAAHLANSTTIILSAKHGQSPILPQQLRRVDDGTIIDGLNAAWKAAGHGTTPLVAFSVDDDGMLLWLSDRSAVAFSFAKHYLLTHSAPANRINDPKGVTSTTVTRSGLSAVYTGTAADRFVGAKADDPHTPDVIGIAQQGVVYTGGVKKIAEHGGDAADDRDVALVVSGAGVHRGISAAPVQTEQIAPTILSLLGIDPRALQAVRIDGTRVLPHI